MAELKFDKTGRLLFTKEMKEEYTILIPMMAPIHFGIIVVMNLVLGLCTPPVGVCLFAATNIGARYGKCTLSDSVKALVPLLIVNFGVLFLVTYVPFLTVGVANLVMG